MTLGIFYKMSSQEKELKAYTDNDFAGGVDNIKSTSGYAFLLNLEDVAWSSKKRPIVILSTTEVEFVAACVCLSCFLDEEDTYGSRS